jgi:hypothetical protein
LCRLDINAVGLGSLVDIPQDPVLFSDFSPLLPDLAQPISHRIV